jgi:hypothetical protein
LIELLNDATAMVFIEAESNAQIDVMCSRLISEGSPMLFSSQPHHAQLQAQKERQKEVGARRQRAFGYRQRTIVH